MAVPPSRPPPAPAVAASLAVFREGPRGREVLLVYRAAERRFAAGFHALPGGHLDPEDSAIEVLGAAGDDAALAACAARELFEETGILAARGAERVSTGAREEARRTLVGGKGGFGDFLRRERLSLDASLLAPAGRWVTPDFMPMRYDARMFLVELPPGERAEIWPGELAGGGFQVAREALARWERGEMLLHPPNLHAVRVLAREGPPAIDRLRSPPESAHRIEFQGGFFLCAMRSATIPPATHTNAWIVPAGDGVAVVDPGSDDPGEQAKLFDLSDALAAEGRPLREVWLTHAHPDHAGAAAAVAGRYGVPVRAHPLAAGRVPSLDVRPVREGELLGGRFVALATPGHARDHLAFLDEASGALLCGDLVSTLSTIVIDPPDGDMEEYERQLERIRSISPRTLYPAHGPPAPDATARLSALRAHRREREALVLAALGGGATLAEATGRAYADVPPVTLPLAERSCLAVLLKLRGLGLAREADGRWSRSGDDGVTDR